ncbi:unnamed protein product [Orchesella dallaii]|uniref:Uncharacterized protein n=1 Tax=Orchesella dallaii TaxID=48710 RepID=A0ABP1QUX5_9HEXA
MQKFPFSTAKIILLVVAVSFFLALLASGTAADNGSPSSSTTRIPTPSVPPRRSAASAKPCIKHPPNFREVDLPCGGYDKPSCERVCMKLGHTGAYCKKEEFCLCHSGNLYSC